MKWYKSKTVLGGALLGLEAGMLTYQAAGSWISGAIAGLGLFLTVAGFRTAMAK